MLIHSFIHSASVGTYNMPATVLASRYAMVSSTDTVLVFMAFLEYKTKHSKFV